MNVEMDYLIDSRNKEIDDLKAENADLCGEADEYYNKCEDALCKIEDLEAQLANSIPRERVQTLIDDENKQHAVGGWVTRKVIFVDDLKALLSNKQTKTR